MPLSHWPSQVDFSAPNTWSASTDWVFWIRSILPMSVKKSALILMANVANTGKKINHKILPKLAFFPTPGTWKSKTYKTMRNGEKAITTHSTTTLMINTTAKANKGKINAIPTITFITILIHVSTSDWWLLLKAICPIFKIVAYRLYNGPVIPLALVRKSSRVLHFLYSSLICFAHNCLSHDNLLEVNLRSSHIKPGQTEQL